MNRNIKLNNKPFFCRTFRIYGFVQGIRLKAYNVKKINPVKPAFNNMTCVVIKEYMDFIEIMKMLKLHVNIIIALIIIEKVI